MSDTNSSFHVVSVDIFAIMYRNNVPFFLRLPISVNNHCCFLGLERKRPQFNKR